MDQLFASPIIIAPAPQSSPGNGESVVEKNFPASRKALSRLPHGLIRSLTNIYFVKYLSGVARLPTFHAQPFLISRKQLLPAFLHSFLESLRYRMRHPFGSTHGFLLPPVLPKVPRPLHQCRNISVCVIFRPRIPPWPPDGPFSCSTSFSPFSTLAAIVHLHISFWILRFL